MLACVLPDAFICVLGSSLRDSGDSSDDDDVFVVADFDVSEALKQAHPGSA